MIQSRRAFPSVLVVAILLATLLILWAMGRSLICPCGTVKLWHGAGAEGPSSQDMMDWYTPSHLLHGFLFYYPLWLIVPRMPLSWRLVIATAVECGWEILENTNWVIDRYRSVTISLDYNGDSVINSGVDILFMLLGFALAVRLPVWASVAIVIGFEGLTAILIRDGLALNVLMLLWPLQSILDWQAGA
ncbi:DUF2585 family protein [Antarcticimicrobium luteum]|uniref:DUF2585 domain-containing protein n=1 Tax=Antarcticimicrobium luteum TaxID=2547397 RepID=A0A4R5V4F2_9RHOB|nr:DUF2585 family protein [Antarcticimicrobium luteum]TDK46798.1 DUF2585 domain-containing protein [Antarcticimicrobium luteum]